jgi:hypothetical protein
MSCADFRASDDPTPEQLRSNKHVEGDPVASFRRDRRPFMLSMPPLDAWLNHRLSSHQKGSR